MSLLPFWALTVVGPLLSTEGQRALRFHKKYLNLCIEDERRSYRFQGSRLILPTVRSFATNFLSWSHEHIIWSQFIIMFFFATTFDYSMHADETFIIVYSYMVTKVFNIQPFFISIVCDLNFVNRNSSFRALSLSLSNSRSWCHVLQEKIIVCFAYIYTPFTF